MLSLSSYNCIHFGYIISILATHWCSQLDEAPVCASSQEETIQSDNFFEVFFFLSEGYFCIRGLFLIVLVLGGSL